MYGNAADHPERVPCYPSDMSNAEWAALRLLLPTPAWLDKKGGRPESYCHRQMLDAIRYLVAGGISWRAMPADFPAWARVYTFFRRWRRGELVTEFHDRLRGQVRIREGREAEPSAGIIDAQSVKGAATVPAASRGYDGGKVINGRKRHVITDCLGLLLVVAVTAASVGDREAATGLLARLRMLHREIILVWADGSYTGGLVGWCRDRLALAFEIVKRTDDMEGFVVLPRRWVVERTLSWLMHSRRLARDYETLPATSEAMIRWSMITRMRRRLARPRAAGRRCLLEQPPAPTQTFRLRTHPLNLRGHGGIEPEGRRDVLGPHRLATRPVLQHVHDPLVVRRENRHRQFLPPGRHNHTRNGSGHRPGKSGGRHLVFALGVRRGSTLDCGRDQGVDELLAGAPGGPTRPRRPPAPPSREPPPPAGPPPAHEHKPPALPATPTPTSSRPLDDQAETGRGITPSSEQNHA
ncbi:IS5 family transposase [Streptomyces sp. NPDC058385]|uniref:IS5 family transposase n=1 Tax=Streptomyces sp. NPDC058385 TaxID=3346473 RepID=UPI0036556494